MANEPEAVVLPTGAASRPAPQGMAPMPTSAAPDSFEDQNKRLDAEIDRRMKAHATNDYGEMVRQYGDAALIDEANRKWSSVQGMSDGNDRFNTWNQFAQAGQNAVRGRIATELEGLRQQKQGLLEGQINSKLSIAQKKEEATKANLMGQQTQMNAALDQQLTDMMAETGYNANLARAGTGQAFADRGLGRSTMAANALGDVTLGEQAQKSGIRTQTEGAKQSVARSVNETVRGIEQRREGAALRRDLSELSGLADQGYQTEANAIQSHFENQMNDIKVKAANKSVLLKIGAGILTAGATIFGGPVAGAGVGAATGLLSGGGGE